MYNRVLIYPYRLASQSARQLADILETRRLRTNGTYRYRPNHLIVNWGNSVIPQWATPIALTSMLNKPQNIARASDKLQAFQHLATTTSAEHLVPWTTDPATVRAWLGQPAYGGNKNAALARTLLRANSGRGIEVIEDPANIPQSRLYTRYKPKQHEYRVHVSARFGIIDAQEKRRASDVEERDPYIRSHDNGWVFCRENLELPEEVANASKLAVHNLGLDFGAVDIGYHSQYGIGIYEVNTAPGLEGQTLHSYVTMIKRYMVDA